MVGAKNLIIKKRETKTKAKILTKTKMTHIYKD